MGVPPMKHGQDARATPASKWFCKDLGCVCEHLLGFTVVLCLIIVVITDRGLTMPVLVHSHKRLACWDYTSRCIYMITLTTKSRESLFGECREWGIERSALGKAVYDAWQAVERRFPMDLTGVFAGGVTNVGDSAFRALTEATGRIYLPTLQSIKTKAFALTAADARQHSRPLPVNKHCSACLEVRAGLAGYCSSQGRSACLRRVGRPPGRHMGHLPDRRGQALPHRPLRKPRREAHNHPAYGALAQQPVGTSNASTCSNAESSLKDIP
jgi:hypothetical protein